MFSISKISKQSFTLLELLIVIGVIVILSATVVISLKGATRAASEARGLQFSNLTHKILITNMVGEWTFDEESNPGYDSSGKGNNGTLVGPPTWTADGKVRGALEFNGTTDYVNCGAGTNLSPTSAITIETWAKVDSGAGTHRMVIAKGLDSTQYAISASSANKFRPHIKLVSGWEYSDGDTTITLGQWYHIVETYDGIDLKIHVNGVEDGSWTYNSAIAYSATDIPLRIGGMQGRSYEFPGTIDEVRVYDAALEASQIKARYVQGLDKLHAEGKLDGKEYYQRITEIGF